MHARLLIVFVSAVLVLGACATIDPREDTRIEAEVKARLVAEKDANLTRLGVLSNSGAVYLTGTVESSQQKAEAETLTKGVRGVKRVINNLQVSAPK